MADHPVDWLVRMEIAVRCCGTRELDFGVAAKRARVRFVVTDVMNPVVCVAGLAVQVVPVEFEQRSEAEVATKAGR